MLVFFHPGGSVHDIPCSSHFTSSPFASAAIWASVGAGFSTGSLPTIVGLLEEDEFEDDDASSFLFDLSLLLKLQAAITKTSRARGISFFIGRSILHWNKIHAPFTG